MAAFAPASAEAGAWIAPEGGQEIWTNAFGERDDLRYYESSTYWEIPIGEDLSLVASPWVEQNYDTLEGWRGEATAGVKRKVYQAGPTIMAVQAAALWVSHPDPGCREGGAELRWLAGRGLGERGFVNLELAQRSLDGGCGGQRLDLTAGFQPARNWLLLGEIFLENAPDQSAAKAQLTLARFGEDRSGVQIGVRGRIDGGDAEPALVVAFWGRPGD